MVKIGYKSGNSVELWFKEFSLKTQDNKVVNAKWELAYPQTNQIMLLGVNDIESAIVIDTK